MGGRVSAIPVTVAGRSPFLEKRTHGDDPYPPPG
jgi:hypothetical protein